MAIDTTKTTYKYKVNADGNVTYTADADGVTQTLAGRDTSSTEALEKDLDEYTWAYINGLESQKPDVGKDITVGQLKTADAEN